MNRTRLPRILAFLALGLTGLLGLDCSDSGHSLGRYVPGDGGKTDIAIAAGGVQVVRFTERTGE
jgi:hypothetical protein